MASTRVNITSPVGRIVMGSLYSPVTKDAEGKPLIVKNGANAGQARVNYFFALAIPKGAEQHWAHTAWGQVIFQVGAAAFPQACQSPAFSWKIEDGDSLVPNTKGRKPADNEGWRGHWILKFSGGFAPKVYRQEGSGYVQVTEPDWVKCGYFVEAAFNVDGNDSSSKPGVYLNHSMVCFRAYGPEIVFGPNVEDAGFGQSPLPAGASMVPVASAVPLPGSVPAAASIPPLPTVAGNAAVPQTTGIPAIPVTPNPQFLSVPAGSQGISSPANIAASPSVIVPPPAPITSLSRMTAKAGGATFEQFTAAGWTEANLIAQGYMNA